MPGLMRATLRELREVRLTRAGLAVLSAVSGLATALVITDAGGRTPAQEAALIALAHPSLVAPASGASPATPAASTPAPATSTLPPPPTTTIPAPSTGPQSASTPAAPTTSTSTTPASSPTASAPKPRARHLFVLALTAGSYADAFGPHSPLRSLATLRRHGTLLRGYRSLTGAELPDELAAVSGQAPNADTRADCPSYSDFASSAKADAAGLISGAGCVYPNSVITVADQVTSAGKAWRAYIDGLTTQTCVHPNSGAADTAALPGAAADYFDRHNPFLYFHSLLDLGGCSSDDLPLTRLAAGLRESAAKAPAYTYIAPDGCLDAAATSCADGSPVALAGENAFLSQWVPKIEASPAFRDHGVLFIVFAPSSGSVPGLAAVTTTAGGASTTTTTTPATTTTAPTTTTTSTTTTATTTTTTTTTTPAATPVPAGGPIGALVLSAHAAHGKVVATRYTPYSLLHTVETLLALKPLGHAKGAPDFADLAVPR